MLDFLAKDEHPFCSQYSLISDVSDVMLMMLRRPKFVRILVDQNKINRTIFTARAYARAVLGVVILSVRLSVCPSVTRVDCDKTKWRTADIFYTTRKGSHSATPIPRVVGGRRPLPFEICVQSDPPPFEKRRLRPISAHNVSTVGDSEKKFNYDEYKVDHGLSNEPEMECVRYP